MENIDKRKAKKFLRYVCEAAIRRKPHIETLKDKMSDLEQHNLQLSRHIKTLTTEVDNIDKERDIKKIRQLEAELEQRMYKKQVTEPFKARLSRMPQRQKNFISTDRKQELEKKIDEHFKPGIKELHKKLEKITAEYEEAKKTGSYTKLELSLVKKQIEALKEKINSKV